MLLIHKSFLCEYSTDHNLMSYSGRKYRLSIIIILLIFTRKKGDGVIISREKSFMNISAKVSFGSVLPNCARYITLQNLKQIQNENS